MYSKRGTWIVCNLLPASASRCKRGSVASELSGAVVRIDCTVDADLLRLVIAKLRA